MSLSQIKAAEQRLEGVLSDEEILVLRALLAKPLSVEDTITSMRPLTEKQTKSLLYQLDKKYLIVKQPVISGGCHDCGCQVSYLYRLTFSGRLALAKTCYT